MQRLRYRMCSWGLGRIVTLACFLNLAVALKNGGVNNDHDWNDENSGVRVEGGPPGVIWVVQVSDIHISKWVPERGRCLRRALGHALKLVDPAIVLVTGDLIDAKNKEKTAARQDEGEWIEYRDSLQKVVDDSGIPFRRFYDLRGNHDKYGVPPLSILDYFSKYSISAVMNRSSLVQSVTVEGRDGQKHLFVGFDDSMTVGLRGPSNTFGHPTDELLEKLDQELKRWDNATSERVTKIVYGHFPMSFTASTAVGKHPEEIIAKNGVTAYLCGHLHTKFGRRLYKHHKHDTGKFWEWEVGDWRTSRMMRILAIDNGHTSFVDVELMPPKDISEKGYIMPTFILQTYPLDSRFMLQHPFQALGDSAVSNSIRTLVFSETIPTKVTARIYDFTFHPAKLVHETSMKLFEDIHEESRQGVYFYSAPWASGKYLHGSGFRYAMQITVEDDSGSTCDSDMRFFSVENEPGEFRLTALAFLVIGFRWERVFPVLMWSMILFSLAVLLIPKIFLHHLQKRGLYEEWIISVFLPTWTLKDVVVKIVKVPFWVFLEGARNKSIWVGMLAYVMCLVLFPWFWGRILGDDYPLGHMSLHGWTVFPSKVDLKLSVRGLGVPDIMGIVIPYMYGVLLPLLLMLSALSAERVACEFHIASLGKWQRRTKRKTENQPIQSVDRSMADAAQDNRFALSDDAMADSVKEGTRAPQKLEMTSSEEKVGSEHHCRLCQRLLRRCLFLGCLGVAYNHWRLCSTILGAYGPMAVIGAPAYAWGVPAMLMLTLLQTSKIRNACSSTIGFFENEGQTLHRLLANNLGYNLVLIGHYTGAAIVALSSMIVRAMSGWYVTEENLKPILPSFVGIKGLPRVDRRLAEDFKFIRNVVLQDGKVACASPAAIETLRNEIQETSWRQEVKDGRQGKCWRELSKLILAACWLPPQRWFSNRQRDNTPNKEDVEGDDTEIVTQAVMAVATGTSNTGTSNNMEELEKRRLFVPGILYHIKRQWQSREPTVTFPY